MGAIFEFISNILTGAGVSGDAMQVIGQIFDAITGFFDMIGNLFGGLLG